MSRISVIIPNFNRSSLVGATIENILLQSLPPDEVIVVDDGSTDNSCEVIRSFGKRVRLIEQANQGPGAARNAGFVVSTGEFIQFMDSDDLASRNKLAVQHSALQSTGLDFAYCPWVRTRISGGEMEFEGPVMQGQPIPAWKPMLEWQLGPWCLVFQSCLFRRSILVKAGGFRIDLMPTEDSEYLVRILMAGARPTFTRECLLFYREHNLAQITSSGTTDRRRADDLTRYLEIIGDDVVASLESFHRSTRLEIALTVFRHNRYCQQRGWPSLKSTSPFSRLTSSFPRFWLVGADYCERLTRKLLRIPNRTPNSRALSIRPPQESDCSLARDLGFNVVVHRRRENQPNPATKQ